MGKLDDEAIKPQAGKVVEVDAEAAPVEVVTSKKVREYYDAGGVNYEQVAAHFNIRVYDVAKVLDEDFRPDPNIEAADAAE
jgi:hypothetical protein